MLPGIPPRREQIGIQGWGIRIDASRRRFRAIALRFLLAERAFLDDDQRFACATPAARTRTVRLSSHADIRRDCRLPSDVNPGGFVNATAFTARLWIHTDVLSLSQLLCSSLIPRWAHYTHHSMMSGLLGVTTSLHQGKARTMTTTATIIQPRR